MKENRILSIQYLRGLAALAVVFCHFGFGLTAYPSIFKIFYFGITGVYVFFLISGFIIVYSLMKANYRPSQFLRFLLKRSIRIDPAYWVTILLTLLLFKFLSAIHFKGEPMPFIPGQFIAHILYIVPFTNYPFYNHVLWTLGVEFQFYLLIGLIYFISNTTIYRIIFLILFSSTCFIPFSNDYTIFHFAPFFALGISLVIYKQNNITLHLLLPTFCLGLIAYKFGLPVTLLLFISSLLIFLFNMNIKPLKFLGDISYSLYLIHPLLRIVFVGILKKIGINQDTHQLFWFFIQVTTSIFVAYLFFLLIEKQSLNLSKKFTYNNKLKAG